MDKLFCAVIKEFENEIFPEEISYIDDFLKFSSKKFRFMDMSSADEHCINKFLFMWVPEKVFNSESGAVEKYVDSLNLFSKYIKEKYNINIGEKSYADVMEIKRICKINNDFKRFLFNPVISYSPMIIDFDIYKKRKSRIEGPCFFSMAEKGYFTVEEFFSGDYILMKKMYTGRFIKVAVDGNILQKIKKNDILYANLRQNPFFVWEFTEVYRYYPANVMEYIKKKQVTANPN